MRLFVNAISDIGNTRDVNEDMILVDNEIFRNELRTYDIEITQNTTPFLIAVADGLGGHRGGEYASEFVLTEMNKAVNSLPNELIFSELKESLKIKINSIHSLLLEEGSKDPDKYKMGSTFIGIMIYYNKMYLINIGDSRLYRFRDGILTQLSRDHSLREKTGISDISKNIITNSFGGGEKIYFDFEDITNRIINNDAFIICTDGLTNELTDEIIENLLNSSDVATLLIETAKKNGGSDNISVIYMKVTV